MIMCSYEGPVGVCEGLVGVPGGPVGI